MNKSFIRARRSPFGFDVEILMGVESPDGLRPVRSLGLEVLNPGDCPSPILSLHKTEAQSLMDQLWECGIRPTEGSGSAGAFAAQARHLEDMRALVFDRERP